MNAAASVSAILLAIAGAFVAGAGWQAAQWRPQIANASLTDQVNLTQLKRMCADQAYKSFKRTEQHKANVIETFMSHYNLGSKKCFMLYLTSTYDPTAKTNSEFLYLEDAFEGVEYGNFDGFKTWEAGNHDKTYIMICERVPGGESRPACKSRHEWIVFAQKYMETKLQDQ